MTRRLLHAAVAGFAAAVMSLGACTIETGQDETSPSTPSSAAGTGTPDTASGPIPDYPGAKEISDIAGTRLLTSGDSVSEVGAFYVDALDRGGWKTTSKYQGEYSVHLLARRGDDGVTIQVSPTGSGTSISITTYSV